MNKTKRDLLERTVAGLVLIAVLPVLAICCSAIFLEDRRPVLFRQRRIGKNGKPFFLLKLRSMRPNSSGRSVTARDDCRITTVGSWLRRYKIDELPQLWNVFRGDMHLIGPRPEVPGYVDLSDPQWLTVLSVKPGITDLASLVFRHEESLLAGQNDIENFYRDWLLPRKLHLSMYYARTRSLASDVRLIGLTLRSILVPSRFDGSCIAQQFGYRGDIE